MKNTYGMELNAVVTWTDSNEKKHTGVLLNTVAEDDGCGHFLVLENYDGGIDEVPVSMVDKAVNPDGSVSKPNEEE